VNLGFNKRVNLDGNFQSLRFSGDTAASAVWSFGLTVFGQRRFREPAPSSSAFFFIPSSMSEPHGYGLPLLPSPVQFPSICLAPVRRLALGMRVARWGGRARPGPRPQGSGLSRLLLSCLLWLPRLGLGSERGLRLCRGEGRGEGAGILKQVSSFHHGTVLYTLLGLLSIIVVTFLFYYFG
jgi:hypothetical protein